MIGVNNDYYDWCILTEWNRVGDEASGSCHLLCIPPLPYSLNVYPYVFNHQNGL